MANFEIKSRNTSIRFEYTNETVNVKVNGRYNTNADDVLTSLNGEVYQDATMIGNFNGMVQQSGTIIYSQSDVPSSKLELFRTTVSEVEAAVLAEIGGAS